MHLLTNINGKNVPLVFYMLDDIPITLAVICNSNIDFSKMKEVMADKMVVYTGTGLLRLLPNCWMERD